MCCVHGEAYAAQQEQQFAEEVRERQEKQLHRRARELGSRLVAVEKPPWEGPPNRGEPTVDVESASPPSA